MRKPWNGDIELGANWERSGNLPQESLVTHQWQSREGAQAAGPQTVFSPSSAWAPGRGRDHKQDWLSNSLGPVQKEGAGSLVQTQLRTLTW